MSVSGKTETVAVLREREREREREVCALSCLKVQAHLAFFAVTCSV